LIALACLNVLAVATNFKLDWYADLLAAQVFIAGCWLALGRAHRLARAGVFVGVILASTAPDFVFGNPVFSPWRFVLGSLIYLACAAAVSGWIFLLLLRTIRRDPIQWRKAWQFSVAELLGWMILVAVAALAVPAAAFQHLTQDDSHWLVLGLAASVAGLLAVLFLRRGPGHDLSSAAIAMVAVTAVLVFVSQFSDRSARLSLLGSYVIVGLWILVQRLDDGRARTAATAAAPSIKIYNATSDDERRRLG
jgi:hypothetical protein